MSAAAGRKCALYYNSGTYASPVWVEIKRITEVARPNSRSVSDRKFRGAENIKGVTGYRKMSITGKYAKKRAGVADTVFDFLATKYDSQDFIDLIAVDQTLTAPTGSARIGTNAVGFRGPYLLSKFDRDEADEDGVTYDLEFVEADEDIPSTSNIWDTAAISIAVTAAV